MLGVTEAVVLLFGRIKAYAYRGIIMSLVNTISLIVIIQIYNDLHLVFIAFLVLATAQLIYSVFLVPESFLKSFPFKKYWQLEC